MKRTILLKCKNLAKYRYENNFILNYQNNDMELLNVDDNAMKNFDILL